MHRISLALVLCACGSSDRPGDVDATPPARCEPTNDVVDLAQGHFMQGMATDDRGPWVVVSKLTSGIASMVIADRTGVGATLATGFPDSSGIRVAPVTVGGKRCIAMHFLDGTFQFACEDGTVEKPALELEGDNLTAVVNGGTVHVFGQEFASYHELRRESGTWKEVEKFESSVSEPEDAIAFGASFASCFISTGGKASVETDDIYYGPPASWCRLIGGGSLGVLTDKGLTTFAGTFGAVEPTALGNQRPLAVGRLNGNPVAVVRRDLSVELQPLPQGTPTVLRTLANSAENPHAVVLGDRIAIISVKPIFDPGTTRYQLVSSTHCP